MSSTDLLTINAPVILNKALASVTSCHPVFNAVVASATVWTLLKWIRASRRRLYTKKLRGPPSESLLYGIGSKVFDSKNPGDVYETWAQEYGPVYEVPTTLGGRRIVLCDPKAIAHFYSKESWTYILTPLAKKSRAHMFGKGNILRSHGESHKRQRRALNPAFSIAAIKQLTSVFYDSAYKAKAAWDALIESSGRDNAIIDVQGWMNYISLDTVGLAGFSHNFGALEGKHTTVKEIFDMFGASPTRSARNKFLILMAEKLSFFVQIPTPRTRLLGKLNIALGEIASVLLNRTRKEMEMGAVGGKEEKSIIGSLIKGTNDSSEFSSTHDEVVSQIKVLIFAAYETTSVSLTWALLELARNPDIQTKLRNELLEHSSDLTYDQITNDLHYLDAVVHENLRIHLPTLETTRVAIEDDVIPLSESIRAKSGEMLESLAIAKGTLVTVSMEATNRSTALWGEDAKVFRPERWLEDTTSQQNEIPAKAKEVQGYRHLLTFMDGPRTCLGKYFAVTELKVVLSVLVKNFVFELRDGPDTKIEIGRGLLLRPKVAGEEGCKLPLRVKSYVA